MKNARKLLVLLLTVVLAIGLFSACADGGATQTPAPAPAPTPAAPSPDAAPADEEDSEESEATVFQIGIIQLVEHPALDAAREGFLAALADNGIEAEIDFQNAQRDIPTLSTIAQRFVNNNVDLVLAIATPSVQAMAAETYTIPIVGSAITSYERAGVVYSNEVPGTNVTGASDMNPIQEQIEMIIEFVPGIETLGIVFSSNEANSVYQAEIARGIAESLGLLVVEGTVTTTGDVQQNTLSVANRVDAIFIPTDNTHADAMAVVGQVSIETGVPVFPGEENMVMGGGVATLSVNYFDLGYQSGLMAVQILRGEGEPATMPIQFAHGLDYIVNGFMVDELGITVPERFSGSIQLPE